MKNMNAPSGQDFICASNSLAIPDSYSYPFLSKKYLRLIARAPCAACRSTVKPVHAVVRGATWHDTASIPLCFDCHSYSTRLSKEEFRNWQVELANRTMEWFIWHIFKNATALCEEE